MRLAEAMYASLDNMLEQSWSGVLWHKNAPKKSGLSLLYVHGRSTVYACVRDCGPVCLCYEPYHFSERTMFFSHNKSANSTFSHGFSAKRTEPVLLAYHVAIFARPLHATFFYICWLHYSYVEPVMPTSFELCKPLFYANHLKCPTTDMSWYHYVSTSIVWVIWS